MFSLSDHDYKVSANRANKREHEGNIIATCDHYLKTDFPCSTKHGDHGEHI